MTACDSVWSSCWGSSAPHTEQKLPSAGLSLPHWGHATWSIGGWVSVLRQRDVGHGGEQAVGLARVVGTDDADPPLAVGIAVDELGRGLQLGVHLDHGAGHRGVQVADGLRRLDLPEAVAG